MSSDANEHLQKALLIHKEIGDRKGEAASYGNLGTVFQSVGDYDKAVEYYEKSRESTCCRQKYHPKGQ